MQLSAACACSVPPQPCGYSCRGVHHDSQLGYTSGSAWQCIRVKHLVLSIHIGVESWSVINDQDAVARGGKFMGLFKRAGDRIFLNQKGDMLVCPLFLEAALWRKLGNTSVRHHMMAAYLKVRVQQLFACYLLMAASP